MQQPRFQHAAGFHPQDILYVEPSVGAVEAPESLSGEIERMMELTVNLRSRSYSQICPQNPNGCYGLVQAPKGRQVYGNIVLSVEDSLLRCHGYSNS